MRNFNSWFGFLALTLAALQLPAAAQTLDPTFAAAGIYAPGSVFSALEQPDGKRVVAGDFTRVNGAAAPGLIRFNADGTLDATFQQNVGPNAVAYRVRQQPNGQLLITSPFFDTPVTAGGLSRQEPLRLNADGTGDASFNVGAGASETGYVNDMLALPNGQTIVVGNFSKFNTTSTNGIARLTVTGAVDASFNSGQGVRGEFGPAQIQTIVAAPDGKFLIGGDFSEYNGNGCNGLARLNADGSFDPTFSRSLDVASDINNIVVQADGKILIAGQAFVSPNPNQSPILLGLVRLLPNGAYDASFAPNPIVSFNSVLSFSDEVVQVQPDNKVIFIRAAGVTRLNADGTTDASFQAPTALRGRAASLTLLANGKVLAGGSFVNFNGILDRPLILLNANGTPDASFQPVLQTDGVVNALVRQSDGKLIVGGDFSEINGQVARRLARFNANGTLDATYATGNTLDNTVNDLALQSDGRVLAATTGAVRRYLTTGAPDNSLNAPAFAGNVTRLLVQPDGRILAGGSFTSAGGVDAPGLLRLLADGSRDNSFAPNANGPGSFDEFATFGLQADGKLLVAGQFLPTNGGADISTIRRLESSGAIDGSFVSSAFNVSTFQADFTRILVQPDGKIIVGGEFVNYGGTSRSNLARLNANGTLDAAFVPPTTTGVITTIALQPNNRLLLGGFFSGAGLPNHLARLLPTGAADASFATTAVPNSTVNTLLIQPDGGLVIGGFFTSIGGQARLALARLTAPNVLSTAAPRAIAERTQAWPVPAHAVLFVAPAPTAHAQSLELLDALGRTVRRQELRAGSAPAQVAVETLPAGLYMLRVRYAEGIVSRAVQVQ